MGTGSSRGPASLGPPHPYLMHNDRGPVSGSQRVGQGLGHQAAREGHPLLALAPGLTCAVILFPRCWASALPRDLCAHIEVTRGDGQLLVSSVPLSWVPQVPSR